MATCRDVVLGHGRIAGQTVARLAWVWFLTPDSAIASLEAHRPAQHVFREQFGSDYRADLDLIFANPDGTALKPDSISSSVSVLFKPLKIPKPKGASHLLAQNEALTTVSERLGHSSPRVTADIYSHASTGRDRGAARKWEECQRLSVEDHPKQ